jgi:four helix bundle protein
VSIGSNIAEGDERDTNKESVRFLYIAKGSLAEMITQIMIAREIGYLSEEEFTFISEGSEVIGKMLGRLIKVRANGS